MHLDGQQLAHQGGPVGLAHLRQEGLELVAGRRVDVDDVQRRAGLPVFVHCQHGVSRSTMVVAAYLMARDGSSRDQALAFIRTKRPSIRPNPAFMRLLLEWQDKIKKPAAEPGGR